MGFKCRQLSTLVASANSEFCTSEPSRADLTGERISYLRWARVSDPAPGPTAGLLNCVSIQPGLADSGHSDAWRPAVGRCGSVGDRPQRAERISYFTPLYSLRHGKRETLV